MFPVDQYIDQTDIWSWNTNWCRLDLSYIPISLLYSCILGRHRFRRGGSAVVPDWQDDRPNTAHTHAHTLPTRAHIWWVDSSLLSLDNHHVTLPLVFPLKRSHYLSAAAWNSLNRKEVHKAALGYRHLLCIVCIFICVCVSGGLEEHEIAKKRGSLYLLLERIRRYGLGTDHKLHYMLWFLLMAFMSICFSLLQQCSVSPGSSSPCLQHAKFDKVYRFRS